MAEEETFDTPYGRWIGLEDTPYWELLQPAPGDVVEFTTSHIPGHVGSSAKAAYGVRGITRAQDGSVLMHGRCIGCDDEEVGKTLTNLLNRRHLPLH